MRCDADRAVKKEKMEMMKEVREGVEETLASSLRRIPSQRRQDRSDRIWRQSTPREGERGNREGRTSN